MINKLAEFLFYLLFLLTPLLMYKNTTELFEFNKMIFIYLIAILLFISWVLKIKKENKIALIKTFLDIPIGIFLLTQIASTVFSIDRYTSFFGFYGRFNGGLLSIIVYVFLFYAFINLFDFNKINRLFKISLLSAFFVMLWGLPGKFGYDLSCFVFLKELSNNCWVDQFKPSERLFSTLGQPNWLGSYLSINFFIALYFLLKEKTKKIFSKKFLIYGGFLLLCFVIILFTRSRSSYLGVLLGLIFFLIFYIRNTGFEKIKTGLFGKKFSLLVILLIISIFVFKTGINSIDRLISLKNSKATITKIAKQENKNEENLVTESFDIRKIVWEGAWKLGLKYPAFGSGLETFAYSYYFTRPQKHNLTSEWDYIYNKAHNEYLNYLATTGFIGVFAYLIMIGSIMYIFIKNINSEKDINNKLLYIALISSYVSILTTNFFGFSTTTINIFFYLIPAFIGFKIVNGHYGYLIKNKNTVLLNILGISFGFYLMFLLISYYIADLNYSKAEKASQIGDYQAAVLYLDKAIKLHNSHIYLNSYSLNVANLAVLSSYQSDKNQTQDLIKSSLQKSDIAISKSPKNINYWKNKSKIEYLFYQINPEDNKYITDAISTLTKAQELSPTDAKIPYSLSIFYAILYDTNNNLKYKTLSLKEIDKSIKLKSNFTDAYKLKSQLLEKYGKL